ncbi:hypothetical protein TNCV_4717301 [Trichonephila clavipes]|nr:hypothetical protein TNCV_4717301 [Trichonephila clavipes]
MKNLVWDVYLNLRPTNSQPLCACLGQLGQKEIPIWASIFSILSFGAYDLRKKTLWQMNVLVDSFVEDDVERRIPDFRKGIS